MDGQVTTAFQWDFGKTHILLHCEKKKVSQNIFHIHIGVIFTLFKEKSGWGKQ